MKLATIELQIAGPGIIIYSSNTLPKIELGFDFLEQSFSDEKQVTNLLRTGRLMGLGTASPGDFIIEIFLVETVPPSSANFYAFGAVAVSDGKIIIRDLYDLISWNPNYLEMQAVSIGNGNYSVYAYSWIPQSEIIGDNQLIRLYFVISNNLPEIRTVGIPTLFN